MKKIVILAFLIVLAGCQTGPPPAFSPLPPRRAPLIKTIAARARLAPSTSTVTVAWDASTDASVIGYRVYEGPASRTYTNVIDTGSATTLVLSNLVGQATYYLAATCYTATGLESLYSVEISYTVPFIPPATNIVTVSNQILVTTDLNLPWTVYTNLPVVTLTNPPGNLYFRSLMSINTSNAAPSGQAVKLDSSTMVFTNPPTK